jgi:hypothetical protein
LVEGDKILFFGGGGNCFSFGSYFSPMQVLSLTAPNATAVPATLSSAPAKSAAAFAAAGIPMMQFGATDVDAWLPPVPAALTLIESRAITDCSPATFHDTVFPTRVPVQFTGCDFGSSVVQWTPDHLAAACPEKLVSLHACPSAHLDFLQRNYQFEVVSFRDMVAKVFGPVGDTRYYVRSLGENVRKDVSDVSRSYPELWREFALPVSLPADVVTDRVFSTALRLSSPGVRLWTHYDMMDNVLCNIRGRKRVRLWRPEEVQHLYVTGSTSAVVDIDAPDLAQFPLFARAQHVDVELNPGDMLYIPGIFG